MLPYRLGDNKDPQLVKVLTSWIFELEKLQKNKLITQDLITSNQWNRSLWSQNRYIEIEFQFGDYVLWFPRVVSKHAPKVLRGWFGPCRIQYCLPNNTFLLVTIDKFDPNPMLININKLNHTSSLKTKPFNLYWLNLVTWSHMNLFKPKNMYHYRLNLKLFKP